MSKVIEPGHEGKRATETLVNAFIVYALTAGAIALTVFDGADTVSQAVGQYVIIASLLALGVFLHIRHFKSPRRFFTVLRVDRIGFGHEKRVVIQYLDGKQASLPYEVI